MRQKVRIWLRNFFGFSRTETNGFIILMFLMIIIIASPFISKKIYSTYSSEVQTENDKSHLSALLKKLEANAQIKKEIEKNTSYKAFDLNKSNAQELRNSGFPKYLAERIVKYRENVKPFDSKAELLKIYGVDSLFYNEISPFINLSEIPDEPEQKFEKLDKTQKKEAKQNFDIKPKKARLESFDINKADSLQLQKIYGIGPAYSKRIIKYRDFLGGFHSLHQLEEVYGLRKENLDSLKKYVFIADESKIKKLKVNHLDADSLVQHPYISYKEANLIVNYRGQHGDFKSSDDLLSIIILDSNWVKKVTPYISFD